MPGVAAMRVSAFASSAFRRGQRIEPLGHQHAAGGAARAAAAHRGMRDAVLAQRLEHGRAGHERDGAPARVGEQRRTAAPLDDARARRAPRTAAAPARNAATSRSPRCGWRARSSPSVICARPRMRRAAARSTWLPPVTKPLSASVGSSSASDQQGARASADRPGLGAQPEMQADHRVRPHDDDGRRLHGGEPRHHHPLQREHGIVGAVEARSRRSRRAPPRRDGSAAPGCTSPSPSCHHSQREREQRAPQVDRPQRIGVVDRGGRARARASPNGCAPRRHQQVQRRIGGIERDQQEGVRRKVTDDEGEHHQRAAEPQTAS